MNDENKNRNKNNHRSSQFPAHEVKEEQEKQKHTVQVSQYHGYWQRLMHSTQTMLSRGAQNIAKFISWARNENWRRNSKKSKK
ncbi:MAG: hypothetical protein WBQ73_00945 [Candidatus Babeliales bacterium]